MPTYEYKCQECGKKFSLFLAINERDKAKCPECQSSDVKQLFTGFRFNSGNFGFGPGSGNKSIDKGDNGEQTKSSASCTKSSCAGCLG